MYAGIPDFLFSDGAVLFQEHGKLLGRFSQRFKGKGIERFFNERLIGKHSGFPTWPGSEPRMVRSTPAASISDYKVAGSNALNFEFSANMHIECSM